MFIACMYVLVGRELRKPKERRKSINKPLLGASLALFVAITLVDTPVDFLLSRHC